MVPYQGFHGALTDDSMLDHEALQDLLNSSINIDILGTPPVVVFLGMFTFALILAFFLNLIAQAWFGPESTVESDIYINDFTVFKEFRPEWKYKSRDWYQKQKDTFGFDPQAVEFYEEMVTRSGINPDPDAQQHIPPGVLTETPDVSMASARYEAEILMFTCVERLLARNNVKPQEVDILVVNCSLFNPTPSLCAMIINRFKMREDIITYNLSGMGCSASPIAVQLASQCLKLSPKKHPVAVVVSTEILTPHIYRGTEREFIMSNTLFRMNASALILSRDGGSVLGRPAPKWKIDNLTRLHLGADDKAYHAIHLEDDSSHNLGVRLSKDLVPVAGAGVKSALTYIAKNLLPKTELIRFGLQYALYTVFGNAFARQLIIKKYNKDKGEFLALNGGDKKSLQNYQGDIKFIQATIASDKSLKHINPKKFNSRSIVGYEPYDECAEYFVKNVAPVPNFKTKYDTFLIHAGGKGIVTSIASGLQLDRADIQHSLNVLHTFGNTSSTSVWYVLDDAETTKKIQNGHRALALCIGSGVKINTLSLTAINRGY